MVQTQTDKYRTQQMMNASRPMLVAMLYDQIARSLNRAIECIEAGDIEGRWRANKNACDCLWELTFALDLDNGGEVASYLDQLYRFAAQQLLQVDLRNDPEPAREVIRLLEPLRQSWYQLAQQQEAPSPGRELGREAIAMSA